MNLLIRLCVFGPCGMNIRLGRETIAPTSVTREQSHEVILDSTSEFTNENAAVSCVDTTTLFEAPGPAQAPASSADGTPASWGQEFREASRDDTAYRVASREAQKTHAVINAEARRAKRLGCEPFDRDSPGEYDRYRRRLEDCERQMEEIRAKYAGQPRVRLHVSLADLGTGLVAAREAAGISQADVARLLDTPIEKVQRLEACAYADLPLAQISSVLSAIGITPTTTVCLWNGVPDLKCWDSVT